MAKGPFELLALRVGKKINYAPIWLGWRFSYLRESGIEWGYWLGWIIAYGLAAGMLIFFVWNDNSIMWCTIDEKDHCFREWVGALAGWAAVAAAAVSLLFLSAQVDVARMQARDTLTVDLRRLIALAGRSDAAAQELQTIAEIYTVTPGNEHLAFDLIQLPHWLDELEQAIEEETFRKLEEEIAFPRPISQVFIRERLRDFRATYRFFLEGATPENIVRNAMLEDYNRICDYCFDYGKACAKIADDFQIETRLMLAKYT